MKKLEDYVRTIPDFPKPGIQFRDITTLIKDPEGFRLTIDTYMDFLKDVDFDILVGAEARGFVFAAPLAYEMNKSLVLIRKAGKLPCETEKETYDLEYGTATIEIHKDSIKPGDKVVIIDDLIATGGTTKAMINLVEKLGGEVVKICFVMELEDLGGRKVLEGYDVESAIKY